MPKRLNAPSKPETIIATDDLGVLADFGKIKAHYESLPDNKKKQRFVAFLNSIYTSTQLSKMLGITIRMVGYAREKNKDIAESAHLAKCLAIGDLCGRKAIELLQKTDVDKIQDRYKPKAVKDLMDSMDIAGMNAKPRQEAQDEDTLELVMRIKKRMRPVQREDDGEESECKEIDITKDVEVSK